MRYFECALPKKAPDHFVDPDFKARLTNALGKIHDRMDKLEEALGLSGLPGEVFSAGLCRIFDAEQDLPQVDAMTVDELADAAVLLAPPAHTVEKRYEWPNAVVLVDTAFVTRHEWETLRTLGIGGSDAAIVLGVSPYRTPLELYYDKTGTPEQMEDNDRGKEFIFSYGHKVESLVVEEFCRRTGAQVIPESRMFAKKDAEWITANIDAIVELPNGTIYIFEAKTTTFFNKSAWQDGSIPRHYVPQCHQYPAVLADKRVKGTYIGCIFGNTPDDFKCSLVPRDPAAEEEQCAEESAFWKDHILAMDPPPLSGITDRDISALRKYEFGKADADKDSIILDDSSKAVIQKWTLLDAEYKSVTKKADDLKKQRDALSLDLIMELQDVITGTLDIDDDTFYEVSYAPRGRTITDVERLWLAYPDAYAECVRYEPESSRVFSIKEKRKRKKK